MHRNILIIRSSDFQFYCANRLFENNLIDYCVIEEGNSIRTKLTINKRNIIKFFKSITNPRNFFFILIYFIMFKKFYGNILFHNKRILEKDIIKLNREIKVKYFKSVNDPECCNFINNYNPEYLIIFGTGIVDTKIYKDKNLKTINMHWGISPLYRGEGIVSALSKNDFNNLGVTIHKLDQKIDDGEIINQEAIKIDVLDNFYSLGLKMALTGSNLIIKFLKKNYTEKFSRPIGKSNLYDSNYYTNNYYDYYLAYKNLLKKKSLL